MTIYLGIDDTDTLESRGTGRLARSIADELAKTYTIAGVTRHQLYVCDTIPYTSHNSSACIHIEGADSSTIPDIFSCAREMMLADFIEGSDPGIGIASDDRITPALCTFGMKAKNSVLTQEEARSAARGAGILLEGLGGTNDGIIGALAGIGLAGSGNDGRYVLRHRTRALFGRQTVASILSAGVDSVMVPDGTIVTEGVVELRKFPKPALRQGRAVLFVEPYDGIYRDLVVG